MTTVLRLPHRLRAAVHRWRDRRRPIIWSGIYRHFRDVPATGRPFDDVSWVEGTNAAVAEAERARQEGWAAPPGDHALLTVVAAMTLQRRGRCAILDYGGGSGDAFVHVLAALPDAGAVTYDVVERPAVAARAAAIWQHDPRVRFHSTLPSRAPDIVYVSSALQYIEDYGTLLDQLAGLGAASILLAKLSAGSFETYATAQRNLAGASIPYWFLNVDEIVERLARSGYRLVHRSLMDREYDQSNFPPAYRMGRACNLLFAGSAA